MLFTQSCVWIDSKAALVEAEKKVLSLRKSNNKKKSHKVQVLKSRKAPSFRLPATQTEERVSAFFWREGDFLLVPVMLRKTLGKSMEQKRFAKNEK